MKTKIKTLIAIIYWLISSPIKWFFKNFPRTVKDFSIMLNLIALNFLIANYLFIPIVSPVAAQMIKPAVKVIVEKEVVEVEIEPTDPDVWVAWRIAKAGLNPLEAAVVQVNESGYTNNDNRFNINTNGSADLGRWQWNTMHIESGFISIECAGNYRCSTEKAIEARLKDGSWSVKWYGARKAGL